MRFIFLLFAPLCLMAQDNRVDLLRELNNQLWIPFVQGVNANDSLLFNGVNAADFHWVHGGAKGFVMDAQAYAEDSYKVMQNRAVRGINTAVEVRFLNRTVSPLFAAEKCIAKYMLQEPGKEPTVFYSIMLVTSKKESGRWKKQLQYATGETATAAQFAQAEKAEN